MDKVAKEIPHNCKGAIAESKPKYYPCNWKKNKLQGAVEDANNDPSKGSQKNFTLFYAIRA